MRSNPDDWAEAAPGNNPYRAAAGFYDLGLTLPGIATIRRQEARVVRELIGDYGPRCEAALEIGPGTGFYTTMLSRAVRHVTAVEDSRGMAQILTRRLAAEGIGNVTVLNEDFRALGLDRSFDLVAAIGVLDYIPQPEPFVAKMCAVARKAVIFTTPQRGLLGACFAASNRPRRISVYCHCKDTLRGWAPGWRCTITEAGLKTPLTKGLTLVAALVRE